MVFEKSQLIAEDAVEYTVSFTMFEIFDLPSNFEEHLIAADRSDSIARRLFALAKIALEVEQRQKEGNNMQVN